MGLVLRCVVGLVLGSRPRVDLVLVSNPSVALARGGTTQLIEEATDAGVEEVELVVEAGVVLSRLVRRRAWCGPTSLYTLMSLLKTSVLGFMFLCAFAPPISALALAKLLTATFSMRGGW